MVHGQTARALVILLAAIAGGCGPQQTANGPDNAAQETPPNNSQTATLWNDLSPLAEQGRGVYARCSSCHAIAPGGAHGIGPNLHGIMGARIGAQDGYVYSSALARADGVWTEELLDSWLEKPRDRFPGHKMAFGGLPNPDDRAAVIAYIEAAGR